MKHLILILPLLFFLNYNASATCNWQGRISKKFQCYYTCGGTSAVISASIKLNDYTGVKFQWTENGNPAGHFDEIGILIAPQKMYNICVKISDTLKNCDTTLCIKINVDCFSNCDWKNRILSYPDAISMKVNCAYKSLMGRVLMANSSHVKYEWRVNGELKGSEANLFYSTGDGTYDVCLKLTDTLLNCDTTICRTLEKKCSGCYWKERINYITVIQKDTCPFWRISGGVAISDDHFINYTWKVDGKAQALDAYYHRWFDIRLGNGTYKLCLELSDTLLKCDTGICQTLDLDCSKLFLQQANKAIGVKLYPNPAGNLVNIDYSDWGNTFDKIEIVGMTGQLFDANVFNNANGQCSLDISELESGLYFLRLLDIDNHPVILKFMKE